MKEKRLGKSTTTILKLVSLCACVTGWVLPSYAESAARQEASSTASSPVEIHIAAQPLPAALKTLADQTGLQFAYTGEIDRHLIAPPVSGMLSPETALVRLLQPFGLSHRYVNSHTVAIAAEPQFGGNNGNAGAYSANPTERTGSDAPHADSSGVQSSTPVYAANSQDAPQGTEQSRQAPLAEVLVTAQKREERLQDVPVPVTAISGASLVSSSQLRLQDYYTKVPGLVVTPDDYGTPTVTIRGITTGGFSNPTVGVVIDDVPYGSSTAQGGGSGVPDVDPNDLARVEVLRGPQGTLYGASSIGGLLKYVTIDPSTDRLTGRLQANTNGVHDGTGVGYDVGGSVNVPLTDTLAARASAFTRRDPGYINNALLGVDGVNEADVRGGRLSTMWRPSDALSLKLNALLQDTAIHGSSLVEVGPGVGDLQQQGVLRGYGGYNRHIQAYSALLAASLGSFKLISATGYSINTYSDSADYAILYGFGGDDHFKTRKFTQEIRLSTSISSMVDWLFGGFYTYENNHLVTDFLAADPTTGTLGGSLYQGTAPTTFSEHAAFTDFTFRITERFDIQLGGRESRNEQAYSANSVGVLGTGPVPKQDSSNSAFTYLATPRFKVSPDLMVYARIASGYRPGGPNGNGGLGLPPTYGSDRTSNYEIGTKGDVFDKRLSFDVSLYYINWRNIQLQLIDQATGLGYLSNASRAKSQGVEFSVDSQPVRNVTMSAWVAWNLAELTEGFPPTSPAYGAPGARLPDTSRFSGNFSLEHTFLVVGGISAFYGGSVSYVGSRLGVFTPTPDRQALPAYAKTDLRVGLKSDSWTVNLFVNNVSDRRGMLNGGLGTNNPTAFQFIQPRTAGIFASKTF